MTLLVRRSGFRNALPAGRVPAHWSCVVDDVEIRADDRCSVHETADSVCVLDGWLCGGEGAAGLYASYQNGGIEAAVSRDVIHGNRARPIRHDCTCSTTPAALGTPMSGRPVTNSATGPTCGASPGTASRCPTREWLSTWPSNQCPRRTPSSRTSADRNQARSSPVSTAGFRKARRSSPAMGRQYDRGIGRVRATANGTVLQGAHHRPAGTDCGRRTARHDAQRRNRHQHQRRPADTRLRRRPVAYTASFAEAGYDKSDYAALVADHLELEHIVIPVRPVRSARAPRHMRDSRLPTPTRRPSPPTCWPQRQPNDAPDSDRRGRRRGTWISDVALR